MTEDKAKQSSFGDLLEKSEIKIPQVGDILKGRVVSASKAEVMLDINGILIGVVRGPELYLEISEYADLEPGDEIEAMVIEVENEKGYLEMSFRQVGQEKAWEDLRKAYKNKEIVSVKIVDANKGGLLVYYQQISGFMPVSQLSPNNYPRVSGGDKGKILEKLKSFIGQEFRANIITLNEEDSKIIFSEKDIWDNEQRPSLENYSIGMVVDGSVTAVTNFGVFISFDGNMEGLIHISEIAWQRINSLNEMFKVGDSIKAEIVNIEGSKIFLSSKRLQKNPWEEARDKYEVGKIIEGEIDKVNPFGLFIKLDDDILALAHISQLALLGKEKISDKFKEGEVHSFEIVSFSPEEHRMGLKLDFSSLKKEEDKEAEAKEVKKEEAKEEIKEAKKEEAKEEEVKGKIKEEKDELKKAKTEKKGDDNKKDEKEVKSLKKDEAKDEK